MAQSTLILRPVSDISRFIEEGRHIPANGEDAYLLVNEVVGDEDSTYIWAEGEVGVNGSTVCAEYVFGLDTSSLPKKINISDIKLWVNCRAEGDDSGSISGSIYLNSQIIGDFSGDLHYSYFLNDSEITKEYRLLSLPLSKDCLETINSYIKDSKEIPTINYSVKITMGTVGEYKDVTEMFLTQTFLELSYEEITNIGIYKKINGRHIAATTAFQKANGTWTEIVEEECKSILPNNNIRSG